MNKAVKIIICMMAFAMILTAFCGLAPVKTDAEEATAGVVIPEFELPMKPYKTFAETGIPLDEIRAAFDSAAEYVFVDGKLRVKSMGEEDFYFYDADYNEVAFELIDGYYYVDITEDEFARGFNSRHRGPDDAWEFSYEGSFDYRFIRFCNYGEYYSADVTIYPDEGWGNDYVTVYYSGANDFNGHDTYKDGTLQTHAVTYYVDGGRVEVTYTAEGEVTRVFLDIDDNYYYYYPNTGWSDDLPKYEDYETSDFVEMVPSMLHCDHSDIIAPGCETLGYCSDCNIITAAPLGHSWEEKGDVIECPVCGIYKLSAPELPKISLDGIKPKAKLSEVSFPIDTVRKALGKDLDVKYEDGVLRITHFEGADVRVILDGEYLDGEYGLASGSFEVGEDDLDDIDIIIYGEIGNDFLSIRYDKNGKALSYRLEFYGEDTEDEIDYLGYVEEDLVRGYTKLYYFRNAAEGAEYSYMDTYLNGKFCEREVTLRFNDDLDSELEIRYDSNGEILYIEAESEGDVYYNFKHKMWSNGRNYLSPADAPAFAEGKTIDELIEYCPSGLDFIKTEGGNPALGNVITIVLASIIVIFGAAFGGYAVGKKKRS